jgi:hypothetical protein
MKYSPLTVSLMAFEPLGALSELKEAVIPGVPLMHKV